MQGLAIYRFLRCAFWKFRGAKGGLGVVQVRQSLSPEAFFGTLVEALKGCKRLFDPVTIGA